MMAAKFFKKIIFFATFCSIDRLHGVKGTGADEGVDRMKVSLRESCTKGSPMAAVLLAALLVIPCAALGDAADTRDDDIVSAFKLGASTNARLEIEHHGATTALTGHLRIRERRRRARRRMSPRPRSDLRSPRRFPKIAPGCGSRL
jgi:hypothetical protein